MAISTGHTALSPLSDRYRFCDKQEENHAFTGSHRRCYRGKFGYWAGYLSRISPRRGQGRSGRYAGSAQDRQVSRDRAAAAHGRSHCRRGRRGAVRRDRCGRRKSGGKPNRPQRRALWWGGYSGQQRRDHHTGGQPGTICRGLGPGRGRQPALDFSHDQICRALSEKIRSRAHRQHCLGSLFWRRRWSGLCAD